MHERRRRPFGQRGGRKESNVSRRMMCELISSLLGLASRRVGGSQPSVMTHHAVAPPATSKPTEGRPGGPSCSATPRLLLLGPVKDDSPAPAGRTHGKKVSAERRRRNTAFNLHNTFAVTPSALGRETIHGLHALYARGTKSGTGVSHHAEVWNLCDHMGFSQR